MKQPVQRRSRSWQTLMWIATVAVALYTLSYLPYASQPPEIWRETDPYQKLGHLLSQASRDPLSDRLGQPTIHPDERNAAKGKHAMVASDVPACSTMGKEILLRGGNAADAAITVALCIGSVNAHSSGIGGGGFILSSHRGDVISIDAREMAPERAHKNMFNHFPLLSKVGGLAVAVPGELRGLEELFIRHGSGNLTWAQLFEPVIALNRKGFACTALFERILQIENELVLSKVPQLRESWDFIFNDHGELKKEGDWITRPKYADTLARIAANGSSAIFYTDMAPGMVAAATAMGGVLDVADFAAYDVIVEPGLETEIEFPQGRRKVYTANGVSSGLALVAGLKFFGRVFAKDAPGLFVHKMIETFKWLAAVRTKLGDVEPDYKQALVRNYTSDEWIDTVFADQGYSDHHTFPWRHYGPEYDVVESMGTAHFSVVDEHGNSVGMTTTVNLLFGSLVYDNTTGIILNNEMDDFSMPKTSNAFNLTPSIYNFIRSHKRPLSSTTPTIIATVDGRPEMVIGAAGGSRIPTAVLQAIVGTYYYNYTMLQAVAYPRLHHQLIPETLMVENCTVLDELYPGILGELGARNHTITETGTLTAMNGIRWSEDDHSYHGVSDFWRKMGHADGY
ncbi:glutathione hydrolase proenzyme [Diutina catenulata]